MEPICISTGFLLEISFVHTFLVLCDLALLSQKQVHGIEQTLEHFGEFGIAIPVPYIPYIRQDMCF